MIEGWWSTGHSDTQQRKSRKNSYLDIPASSAEILEAVEIPAIVWALAESTRAAQGVLQVRINLDLINGRNNFCNKYMGLDAFCMAKNMVTIQCSQLNLVFYL